MKACDKQNSHINSKLQLIYISSNNARHPVTMTTPPLSTLHFFPFKHHPTTHQYPLIWLNHS